MMEEPTAGHRIQKLNDEVVNRIAAGEVVHRPASAIKELLENSLDAKATSISVVAKDGGLASLVITDNGHGIHKGDLGIVCERFTTSKLKEFEDLQAISTYGFRGEALASVTHVAHVTITTKTKDSPCAYRAKYMNGKLQTSANNKTGIQPLAGIKGTQILVEDLFYNVPTRRKALTSKHEEYKRILDVVTKYSIRFGDRGVGFSCKKAGQFAAGLRTKPGDNTKRNIRTVYGSALAKELLKFDMTQDVGHGPTKFEIKTYGWITNANYGRPRAEFILFINDRLVKCSQLKRSIEAVYSDYLPRKMHPFVFLALTLPPQHVDVNVHPTKSEVHFLWNEEVIDAINEGVRKALVGANDSRSFMTQTILDPSQSAEKVLTTPHTRTKTTVNEVSPSPSPEGDGVVRLGIGKKRKAAPLPNRMVRTDASSTRIDAYMHAPAEKRSARDAGDRPATVAGASATLSPLPRRSSMTDHRRMVQQLRRQRRRRPPDLLTSIENLLDEIDQRLDAKLHRVLTSHVFVGHIDQQFALVQHNTKLYLVNHRVLSKEFFYQQSIRSFSAFDNIKLEPPAPIEKFLGIICSELKKDSAVVAQHTSLLLQKKALLQEYFALRIEEDGCLHSVPSILLGHEPELDELPQFLWNLATKVDWLSEQPCFRGISEQLATFYSALPVPLTLNTKSGRKNHADGMDKPIVDVRKTPSWVVEHLLFPAFKSALDPPRSWNNKQIIMEVACLQKLYRVFERC